MLCLCYKQLQIDDTCLSTNHISECNSGTRSCYEIWSDVMNVLKAKNNLLWPLRKPNFKICCDFMWRYNQIKPQIAEDKQSLKNFKNGSSCHGFPVYRFDSFSLFTMFPQFMYLRLHQSRVFWFGLLGRWYNHYHCNGVEANHCNNCS